ncbi:secretin N-terminal domain-containing protein [Planctomycetota bacterium]
MNRIKYIVSVLLGLVLGLGAVSCHTPPALNDSAARPEGMTVQLEHLAPVDANQVLSALQLGPARLTTEPNTIKLAGTPTDQQKALIVLSLMDSDADYVVESLGPASMVRSLPSNGQIARAMGGDITLGTFTDPPTEEALVRGLLDIHGQQVILIVPAGYEQRIRQVIAVGQALLNAPPSTLPPQPLAAVAPKTESSTTRPAPVTAVQIIEPAPVLTLPKEEPLVFDVNALAQPDPNSLRGVLRPYSSMAAEQPIKEVVPRLQLANGDDVLELTLPEKIDLIALLDMAGEYLDLDYVYDTTKIRNAPITLRLHGKREGQLRLRDLYALLETALKFQGLAMTRQEGNLVSIVPVSEALEVDPTLVTPGQSDVSAGDMVVTRVFELDYVAADSVTQLLQSMKLGVAVTPIVESQTLFVTCYAHRMPRIEQLVSMADRPGATKEFRFRQLQFTPATAVADKVKTLAVELQGVSVTVAAVSKGTSGPPLPPRPKNQTADNTRSTPTVYLDTDERTNRLLMIGAAAQLDIVEQLIDTLDVAQQDVRRLHVYRVKHLGIEEAMEKLQMIGLLEGSSSPAGKAGKPNNVSPTAKRPPVDQLTEAPQLVPIETTNSLLINASYEQHRRIARVLGYIDVSRFDLRRMQVYSIEHVEAEEVLNKLRDMEVIGRRLESSGRITGPAQSGLKNPASTPVADSQSFGLDEPQVTILETTNSLLVNATDEQHLQIQTLIRYVDTQTPEEAIPYEIYFLENQSPDHLAEVLNKIVQETVEDQEGKIEKVLRDKDDDIVIVPDELTFSLIVYANRKNQDWISALVTQLDRRRAQVLLDATLVEVTKSEEFSFDLNIISSIPDLAATSGLMGPIAGDITTQDIMDRLTASGRDRFIDMQSDSGMGTGFYGDKHVMLLLEAMDEKKYGRVLAKPKILVNDNEAGTITTKETTYVMKKGQAVLPGNSEAITTSIDYTPYDAGITLDITPHISDADLLRLEIILTRSDFEPTTGEKPPDQSSSDIKTVVTVPDGSTVILGGMLKMNQSKGGTKVPGLGDVPIVGGLFRGTHRSNLQKRLYVFVKAEIIRPTEALAEQGGDLQRISDENRLAFETIEKRFQDYQLWPGVDSRIIDPCHVLDAR